MFSGFSKFLRWTFNRWDFHGTDLGTGLQFGRHGSSWCCGFERDTITSHGELFR